MSLPTLGLRHLSRDDTASCRRAAGATSIPVRALALTGTTLGDRRGCGANLLGRVKDQTRPGHTRISTTLEIYTDTDEQASRDALTRLHRLRSQTIRLRRCGKPEEFARTAAFVLSPAASYISGAMIPVDGGAIPPSDPRAVIRNAWRWGGCPGPVLPGHGGGGGPEGAAGPGS